MKIAMLGIRGVPARYGGLETCAEEVATRLVERGHEVVVYCRKGTWDDNATEFKGVRRITLPSLKAKFTDTYSHSLLCMFHVLTQKPDVILAFNPGIGSLCVIPKIFGYPIALNPDGFDWRRGKWGGFAKAFILGSAWICAKLIDQMIADSVSVRDFYNDVLHCRRPAIFISNGADGSTLEVDEDAARGILKKYGLERDGYILFLSRHVPENSCERIIRAFENVETDKKLFFGGSDDSAYASRLQNTNDPRIVFPGGLYDPSEVKVLHDNCYFLVHGNQAGGMSLGLLKAMGLGTCVLTLNTPDNMAVVQSAGAVYEHSEESLSAKMRELLDDPEAVRRYRVAAREQMREEFSWDRIAEKYEATLQKLVDSKRRA
ncbi:MAG: glycosyltransferase [Candidatus Hydrogenedentes bacterium]|nr:glycosyltransferase [Candidatus Hydrogenedentota bacterium]